MLSKQVADRESSSREVVAAFSTHGETAAQALEDRLRRHLREGESLPDMKLVLALVARDLAAAGQSMTVADRAQTAELNDDVAPRDARDASAAAVTGLVNNIRLALTGQFGEDFGGKLGALGAAPRAPGEIASWGWKVFGALKSLAQPAIDVSDDDNDEVAAFSKDDALRKLRRRLEALDAAITAMATEDREGEQTLTDKTTAIAAYDDTFSFAARFLETLLIGAGRHDLAARVTPSTRRLGQTVGAANDPTPVTPGEPVA